MKRNIEITKKKLKNEDNLFMNNDYNLIDEKLEK